LLLPHASFLLRPTFGDDVPVPGTGLALLLLLEREHFKAREQRDEGGGVAIEMRVPALLGPIDDKGIRGDGATSSVIDVRVGSIVPWYNAPGFRTRQISARRRPASPNVP
jgi:hypothetical protein